VDDNRGQSSAADIYIASACIEEGSFDSIGSANLGSEEAPGGNILGVADHCEVANSRARYSDVRCCACPGGDIRWIPRCTAVIRTEPARTFCVKEICEVASGTPAENRVLTICIRVAGAIKHRAARTSASIEHVVLNVRVREVGSVVVVEQANCCARVVVVVDAIPAKHVLVARVEHIHKECVYDQVAADDAAGNGVCPMK
jgi:hypothetical protein